ncbi:hypothetical protein CM19_10920 [Candidatus Acidianus copahuensis]|uniref:Uncharacterized protein n=1 Tax=Candidatus Acidianus copahuensis TaxID=1160895 RepID=A0A031LKM8_9CREN|nr:hypothetical protein [Candidatus Acidianus copahuensis]EZQ02111.1 hypothetical protein CM19_10920 [Candidatus Acidianus copahuensis]
MELRKFFLLIVIAGQIPFILEIISMLVTPGFFNSHYGYFTVVNYFFLFAIQFTLIFALYFPLSDSKLKYSLPLLLIPVIGQIMVGVYIILKIKNGKKILYTVLFYIIYIFSIISSNYVAIPEFPASASALKLFSATLGIADAFNLGFLLYIFYLLGRFNKA